MEKDILILKKRLKELATKSYQQNRYMYTAFLSLYEQSIYLENKQDFGFTKSYLYGGHKYAERCIVCFGDALSLGYEEAPPVVCLSITPISKKYQDHLTHRDFLGALMQLGIERSMLGDICIVNNIGYVFCLEHIATVITEQLNKIKHTIVMCEKQETNLEIQPHFKEMIGYISSCRLDTIIGLAFQLSRSQSVSYIQEKKVFINGKLTCSNGSSVKEGVIISVRGLGRFLFQEISGTSKKGKLCVILQKFV